MVKVQLTDDGVQQPGVSLSADIAAVEHLSLFQWCIPSKFACLIKPYRQYRFILVALKSIPDNLSELIKKSARRRCTSLRASSSATVYSCVHKTCSQYRLSYEYHRNVCAGGNIRFRPCLHSERIPKWLDLLDNWEDYDGLSVMMSQLELLLIKLWHTSSLRPSDNDLDK